MEISKYISDYLVEYNTSVVVPQLGCFTIVNIPSEIRDGMVTPPSKTVRLDSDLINDDHVLTLYVARKENISVEQAAEEIRNFYQQNFVQNLSKTQNITIEGLGTFSLNESEKIEFIPDANLFKTNYGFENIYIPGKAPEPPTWNPIAPEPPISDSVVTPEPPILDSVVTSEPVIVQPPQPEIKETMETQTNPEESLFDTGSNIRYRENPTRREPRFENQKPPTKSTQKPFPKKAKPKEKEKGKTGSSYLWLLLVLLGAAGLGVAGYFFYPKISPMISPLLEKIPFISSKTPVAIVIDEIQDEDTEFADKTDESTPNTGISQSLDDATDKKNALKPGGSQQTQPTTTSTSIQSQGTVGRGKYGIIVASLLTHEDAEAFGRSLNKKHGYSYEVIEAVANGVKRYRVSVDSFDDWKDSNMYVEKWKNKPDCKDAWPAKK